MTLRRVLGDRLVATGSRLEDPLAHRQPRQLVLERADAIWEQLPGEVEDSVARATRRQIVGEARLPVRTALEEQGLHQIGRLGCAQLRCFECPIAELAMRFETQPALAIEPGARH